MITTACNAATMPVIGPYLDELQKWLSAEGFGGSVLMMLSNGGVVSADDAARVPIRLVESGPAAGALAGSWFAERLGEERLLCFDMGGTTAKACLIARRRTRTHQHVRGRPHLPVQEGLGVPGVRCRRSTSSRSVPAAARSPGPTIRPAQGGPRVGRRRTRAGVATGAAAREPAVTDADVVLGLLDPATFLGGDMALDAAAAVAATERVGAPLGLGAVDDGRRHPRDRQPEHGGRGPDARRRAGRRPARRVVARLRRRRAGPRLRCRRTARGAAGHLPGQRQRAVGVRHARVTRCASISPARMPRRLDAIDPAERDALLEDLRAEGRRVLAAAGSAPDAVRFRYGLDARYAGQGNEVTVWVAEGTAWTLDDAAVLAAFETRVPAHLRAHDPRRPRRDRHLAARDLRRRRPGRTQPGCRRHPARSRSEPGRSCSGGRWTPSTRRCTAAASSAPATGSAGPAIVEERETTAVIRPGWHVEVGADGSMIATRSESDPTNGAPR